MQTENLQHVIDVLDVPELPKGAEVFDLGVIVPNLESGKINTCIYNLVIVNISDSGRPPPPVVFGIDHDHQKWVPGAFIYVNLLLSHEQQSHIDGIMWIVMHAGFIVKILH